jgi:protein gp37
MSAGLEEEAADVCCEDARRAARAVGASVRTLLPEPVVWAFDASVLVASAAVVCGESGSGLRGVSVCVLFCTRKASER